MRLRRIRSSSTGSVTTLADVVAARSVRPCAAACGAKSAQMRASIGIERDVGELRVQRARLEPRQVEQLREQAFERLDRGVDVGDQRRHLRVARPGGKRGGEQADRVQRLAQVMARGGKELALRAIGGFGGGARGFGDLRLHFQFVG